MWPPDVVGPSGYLASVGRWWRRVHGCADKNLAILNQALWPCDRGAWIAEAQGATMSKIETVTPSADQIVRALQDNELDAVTGGALNAYMNFADPKSECAQRFLGSPER